MATKLKPIAGEGLLDHSQFLKRGLKFYAAAAVSPQRVAEAGSSDTVLPP